MPSVYQISGQATASLPAGFSTVSGTATADYQADTQVSGTTVTDAAAIVSWLASTVRGNRVRVLLGLDLEDVSGLVGDVEIVRDAGSFTPTASFTLVDPRCAYFSDPTFCLGGIPVVILGYSEVEGIGSEHVRFQGYTEATTSEDPYVPRTTFRAVGISAWLTERNANAGCVRDVAFGGHTRMELLGEYITRAGATTPTLPVGSGTRLMKPVDLSGLSVVDLARRWAELEGVYVRDLGGVLDLVPEANVLAGPAKYTFAPANYFATKETPPDHPTTVWTLSGVRVLGETLAGQALTVDETESGGVDSAGDRWQTIQRVYKKGAVEYKRVTEEWKDYKRVGYLPDWPSKSFLLVKRITVLVLWNTASVDGYVPAGSPPAPTSQAAGTDTTIEAMFSPLMAGDVGSGVPYGVLWTDGTYHVHQYEQFMEVTHVVVQNGWDASCLKYLTSTVTYSYYSPLFCDGYPWSDGTRRADYVQSYMKTASVVETCGDNAGGEPPYASWFEKITEGYHTTSHGMIHTSYWDGGQVVDVYTAFPNETFGMTAKERKDYITLGGGRYSAEVSSVNDTESKSEKTIENGDTPSPDAASPTTPQYQTEALYVTVSGMQGLYPTVEKTESVEDAESAAELEHVGWRRLCDDLAVREVISAPCLPVLELFDRVALVDPCREVVATSVGYLERITERWSVLNGLAQAEFVVAIPPEELL